jgi:hypothetical protein
VSKEASIVERQASFLTDLPTDALGLGGRQRTTTDARGLHPGGAESGDLDEQGPLDSLDQGGGLGGT